MIEVASSIVMGFLFLLSFSFLVFMHHTSANSQVTGCLSIIYFSTFENCINLIFPKILVIYCFMFVFVPLFILFFLCVYGKEDAKEMEEWEGDQKIRFNGITKYPKNSKTKIKEQIKSTRAHLKTCHRNQLN